MTNVIVPQNEAMIEPLTTAVAPMAIIAIITVLVAAQQAVVPAMIVAKLPETFVTGAIQTISLIDFSADTVMETIDLMTALGIKHPRKVR